MNNLNHTDFHYVDEDMTAISSQGGAWIYGPMAGVTDRELNSDPTHASNNYLPTVASMKKIKTSGPSTDC